MPLVKCVVDKKRSQHIERVLRYITEMVSEEAEKNGDPPSVFFLNYYANVLAFCKDLMEVAHRSVIEFLKNEEKENGVGG